MMQLAGIIDRYEDRFEARYGHRLGRDHRRALEAARACGTSHYGHTQLGCEHCGTTQACFHACGHRSCPRCQNHNTTQWLARQRQKLLPVEYFMVTFTLPYELRNVVWHHQQTLYALVFQCAVSTLKDFGINDNALAGELAMTAVLHTHTRRLEYHPHVHIIVPGGCLNKRRRQWKKLKGRYLFNAFALAKVFRGRFLAGVQAAGITLPATPARQWVVNCQHVGRGQPALEYLSRYLYRGVISEKSIIDDNGTHVTFRYQDSQSKTFKTRCVPGEEFLWLVFQHVLPKGFRRVRDYGFLNGNAKQVLQLIQVLLKVIPVMPQKKASRQYTCPSCGKPMTIIAVAHPVWRSG